MLNHYKACGATLMKTNLHVLLGVISMHKQIGTLLIKPFQRQKKVVS